MFSRIKYIIKIIKNLNNSVEKYKKDTIIQSLPTLTYVNRAKKMLEQNNYADAERILLEALELPQKDPLVYKYLGIVYERIGKNELAVENYRISAEIDPQDKNIWQRLGFALITVGKFVQAEKSFENSDKIQSEVSDTYTGWGMALMKQKKYSEAREKFAHAMKINKYNFSVVFLCAVMEINLEMYDKAEAKLLFLSKVCPNEGNSFEYARLKMLKKDYNSAIHYANKAIEYNSNMLPAYILLGQVYSIIFDKENSLKAFETAFQKGLATSNFFFEWGKALENLQEYDEALNKLKQAYELDKENSEIMALLGCCYVMKKDFDNAEPLLQKAIDVDVANKNAKQALGIVAFEKGEIEKAISILGADDENYINCYYLARCFESQNNNMRVVDYYEASLRINPKYTKAYIDYVKYLVSKGEYADAQRKLRKALKNEPDSIALLNLMFYVSYILVKDNICEYNVKETLAIAEKIESSGNFEYPEQKQELVNLLLERDKN